MTWLADKFVAFDISLNNFSVNILTFFLQATIPKRVI